MLRKLLELIKDSATYGLGAVLERLVGFLLIPLYTRYLVPADYGVLGMLAIISMMFEVFAFLGMRSSVFREFSLKTDAETRRRVVTNGLITVTVLGFALAALTAAFSGYISHFLLGSSEYARMVSATGLSSAFAAIFTIPLMVLQADRKAKTVSLLNLGKLLATASITIVLVVVLQWGVWGVVISALATNVLFALPLAGAILRQFGFEWNRAIWNSMMAYGMPFVPFRLQSVAIGIFADYSVRLTLGLHEAGLYNVAGRFALPLAFVVTAVNTAWWPYKFKVFREEQDPEQVFRSVTTYYFASMYILWVFVALWGPEILRLMTPREYHDAASIVPVLALYRLMMGIYQMFATGIELADKPRSVWTVGTAGIVACVASTYALVPHFQAIGAAAGATIGFIAMTAAVYRVTQKLYHIRHDWMALGTLTALAVGTVAFGYAVSGLAAHSRIGVLSVVTLGYPLATVLVLGRSQSERRRVRSALQRVAARFRRAG
jgi:O-antigen/teichoic acid export membrane protein